MKIPFLKIWVTRFNWEAEARYIDNRLMDEVVRNAYLKQELSKYKTPRGKDGRFKSKKDKMTKQLKSEVADLRKAGL